MPYETTRAIAVVLFWEEFGCFVEVKRCNYSGLAVLVSAQVVGPSFPHRCIFGTSFFWRFCRGENTVLHLMARVSASIKIKWLLWMSVEAWVCGASVLPCLFCLWGRQYLPRTLCFYLNENTSLVVSFARRGKQRTHASNVFCVVPSNGQC